MVCFVCLFQIDTLKKKIEKRRVKISKVTERFDVFAFAFDSLTEYDKRKCDFGPSYMVTGGAGGGQIKVDKK